MKDIDFSKVEKVVTEFRDGNEIKRLYDKDGNFIIDVIIDKEEQAEIREIDAVPTKKRFTVARY